MRLKTNRHATGLVMEALYRHLGVTRQGVNQRLQRLQGEAGLMKAIEEQVTQYRGYKGRRAGSRPLFYNLNIKEQFGIGVAKFEGLMSDYGLTLAPLRIRVVTTKSVLQSWNYNNLANRLAINGINQVVAGDLTYLSIGLSRYYLFCLTDVYSARLVGFWASGRMRAEDAKKALDAWVELRGEDKVKGCIHHSDGGSQYFSELYLEQLNNYCILISVAQNCLQNGFAEQRNGLFKHHLVPTAQALQLEYFRAELQRIFYFYNYERKQLGLGWRAPVEYEQYIESLEPQDRPAKRLHNFGDTSQKRHGFL